MEAIRFVNIFNGMTKEVIKREKYSFRLKSAGRIQQEKGVKKEGEYCRNGIVKETLKGWNLCN